MLLNNVRILDLSQYIPGPYITRMLADLGAEVIKVEPPGGDPMRNFSAESNNRISAAYVALNHGKKIVRLNLKDSSGLSKIKQLLKTADVLIDGFRPGTLEKLELNQETINRINPKLIHCALSGFGQSGPKAMKAGHDLGYCAVAGILGSDAKLEGPAITYPPLADHVGGLQASNSILAALYSRTQTGEGVFIDASLYEPVLAWQYLVQCKHIRQVLGGDAAYYNVYQTYDGKFITLSALENKFWKNFCIAVNKPKWINRHNDELPQLKLKSEMADYFKATTKSQLDQLLADVDCCYEPIPAINLIDDDPHVHLRGITNHYPNIINNQRLSSSNKITEIFEIERIDWNK